MEVPDFACHTQAVERSIKRISAVSVITSSDAKREGYILSQNETCKLLPVNEGKKSFMELVKTRGKPGN